jgi:aerobic carbon-monoxide dehydrogenase small subunit
MASVAGDRRAVSMLVNGERHLREVPERMLLSDFLRHELGLYSVHVGCEHGVCGACTVLLDGLAVRSCLLFAVQIGDGAITTVEGLQDGFGQSELHPIQAAFRTAHGLQCGFCTPGFVLSIHEFLGDKPDTEDESAVRKALAGNLCRCTGYQNIVEAVRLAAAAGADKEDES